MQQAVRDSVAVLFDNLMTHTDEKQILGCVSVMHTILKAGGVKAKDVSDWIRAEKSIPSAVIEVVMGHDGKPVKWTPAPEAPLPNDDFGMVMNQGEALAHGIKYVQELYSAHHSRLGPKELEFLQSLLERFDLKGRWLTTKQLRWLDMIAAKQGHPVMSR